MKQFYYGNIYEREGYGILSCDPEIPASVRELMCSIVDEGIDRSDDKKRGVIIVAGGAVIYSITRVMPRSELGEKRKTYFSHQYYIGNHEMQSFINNMPSVLKNIKFENGYRSDGYDISELPLPVGADIYPKVNQDIKNSIEQALKKSGHVLIHGKGLTCEKAYGMAADLIGSLGSDLRIKASFTAIENNLKRSEITDRAALIFCEESTFESLTNYYNSNCIYYNLDTGKIVDTDPRPLQEEGSENGGVKKDMQEERKIYSKLSKLEKKTKNCIIVSVLISCIVSAAVSAAVTVFVCNRIQTRITDRETEEEKTEDVVIPEENGSSEGVATYENGVLTLKTADGSSLDDGTEFELSIGDTLKGKYTYSGVSGLEIELESGSYKVVAEEYVAEFTVSDQQEN